MKKSFPEPSAAVLMGEPVYLYVNSFLWVIGLVDGRAQIRCFAICKVLLLISDFLCQHEAISASSALNPLNESMRSDDMLSFMKHGCVNIPATCWLSGTLVLR